MEKPNFLNNAKIYIAIICLQFGFAGSAIVAKFALNKGTNHYTLAVYRNAIAAAVFAPFALVLERKTRPKMTWKTFLMIMLLGLLDPVMGQNLFYAGMEQTTATFTSAMTNVLPALTFIMAWILRVEKVNLKKRHSQVKIIGTIVTVGGAMIMTLVAGPAIGLPWTNNHNSDSSSTDSKHHDNPVRGAILIAIGEIGYSLFYIFQAITLKSYPAGLSLTALICGAGALQGTILTFIIERGNTSVWAIGWDIKLLAYVYEGVISSGVTIYIAGVIMKAKGPVFVTAFNPLNMVIIAILSSFIFHDILDVGKVTGAVVIIIGLYMVIWGKSKDQVESNKPEPELPVQQPHIIKDEIKSINRVVPTLSFNQRQLSKINSLKEDLEAGDLPVSTTTSDIDNFPVVVPPTPTRRASFRQRTKSFKIHPDVGNEQ